MPKGFSRLDHRSLQEVFGIGGRLVGHALTEALDPHWSISAAPGKLCVGDEHRRTAENRHDDLEHVQRRGDHRAGEDVVDGDRDV
jgi:hypothetical protein